MNLYDKIRNAECEIPESFCMSIRQVMEFIDNSPSEDDLVWTVFKFGYMQRCRAEQAFKTNKARTAGEAESETEQLRRHICELASQIRSERRLRNIYTVTRRAFINDRPEGLNECSD